jgi:predicted helicase
MSLAKLGCTPSEEISDKYKIKDTRDWKLNTRRNSLSINNQWEKYFTRTLYRPFDIRYYYHHADVVEFPRDEIVGHLLIKPNFALLWTRPLSPSYEFSVLVSSYIPHQCVIGNKNSGAGASYLAPFYIYSETNQSQQISLLEDRQLNFSSAFIKNVELELGYIPAPEDIFYYIYAIFYCPNYRIRYAEFLKIDFPRVPLTSNNALFRQLAKYGEDLVALHLMESRKLDTLITQFEGNPNPAVDAGHPKYLNGKVTINKKGDGFTGVPEEVWNFYVGGYQVCHKWLKDRKGRTLSPEDITHYQRIVVALQETIRLMQQIDAAIPGWPLE